MFNRMLFWLALGFLIYVVATARSDLEKVASQGEEPRPSAPSSLEQKTSSMVENAVDNIIRPAMKGGAITVGIPEGLNALFPTELQNIEDITPGQGNVAVCGSKATVRYVLGTGELPSDTVEIKIGFHQSFVGLEKMVIGMKENGIRKGMVPASLLPQRGLDASKKAVVPAAPLKVELVSVSPALSYDAYAIQLFDKVSGEGAAAQCADAVQVQYVVRTLEGKLLVDTMSEKIPPLTITLGNGNVPFGIEQAIIGMKPNGVRTAILLPSVMQRLGSEKVMLEGEADYPKSGLLFELTRIQ